MELTFDFLNCAAQCPLPDSEPSTPETNTENINFSFPNNPSHIERQYKLIQIDENTSFYLIRYNNNKPYIPCFNLARLLQLSESDILSETVKLLPYLMNIELCFFLLSLFSYYHVFVLRKNRIIV